MPGMTPVDLWTTPSGAACADSASNPVVHNSTGASSAEGRAIVSSAGRVPCRMTRFHRGIYPNACAMTRPLEDNRAGSQGDRGDPTGIAHPARCHLDQHLRQFGPRRRAGEQRRVSGRPLLRACGEPILRRANDQIDASRPTGEATVNVALAVADHHHRRRIRQQCAGSLSRSQRMLSLSSIARWRRGAASMAPHGSRFARPAGREQPPSRCRWRPGDG